MFCWVQNHVRQQLNQTTRQVQHLRYPLSGLKPFKRLKIQLLLKAERNDQPLVFWNVGRRVSFRSICVKRISYLPFERGQ